MRFPLGWTASPFGPWLALWLGACSASPEGNETDARANPDLAGPVALDASGSSPDQSIVPDLAAAPDLWPLPVDTIESNRDRLLGTYLDYLKSHPAEKQSNGLQGATLSGVCDLWTKLDASSQDTFLTLTARMQGSTLGTDGSSVLWHVLKLYRVTGGQGAAGNNPGSCGGAEYNRMIMSMDAALQSAQLGANQHKGGKQQNGKYDISDIPQSSFWRDSHDVGGPHAPFNLSDETNQGAPRGQTQYFADPKSKVANSPLGRMDLATLVDPYALEMDQDYDCVHSSNPLCTYITYGPLCLPLASAVGTEVYSKSYGDWGMGWRPVDCAGK